jgi:hypothetical protein
VAERKCSAEASTCDELRSKFSDFDQVAWRSEILDKSSVNETLKDSLMQSPLTDKMFGLPLQKVQEEVSKAPQSVSVNVRLNNGKRTIAFSSSGYQPDVDACEDPKRLKREWETPTDVVTV